MKQLSEIVDFYNKFPENEQKFAFALLFRAQGSSYRKVGARMLIHLTGEYAGGISGGCLEKEIQKKAKLNLMLDRHEIVAFNTGKNSNSSGANLGCDGTLEILLYPIKNDAPFNPVNAIKTIYTSRKPEVLCTIITSFQPKFDNLIGNVYNQTQLKELILKNEELNQLKSVCNHQLKSKKSDIYTVHNQLELIAEYIQPKIRLIIVGENRDIVPLVNFANILGWDILVCGRKNSDLADAVHQIETHQLNTELIDNYTAIVFMTHDFDSDVKNFPKIIDSNAFYIGLLGPEKRKLKLLKTIDKLEAVKNIAGPIGITIGAKSPEEIALATCAEIQLVFSQKINLYPNLTAISNEVNAL